MSPKQSKQKKSRMTLANKITIFRIVFIPVIVICLIEKAHMWAMIFLGFSIFTDLLDGFAARTRGEKTKLGAFLDPVADKLLLSAVFMTLTAMDLIETWVFVVIFSRDLLIVLGWSVIYILTSSATVHPRTLGKITTAAQMVTAFLLMSPLPPEIKKGMILVTVVLTIISSIDYLLIAEKKLGQWS